MAQIRSVESAPTPAQQSVRASPPLHDVPPDIVSVPADEQFRQPSLSPVPESQPVGAPSQVSVLVEELTRRSARGHKSVPLLSNDSMEPDDSDDDASDFAQTDLTRRTHYSQRGEPVVTPSSDDNDSRG